MIEVQFHATGKNTHQPDDVLDVEVKIDGKVDGVGEVITTTKIQPGQKIQQILNKAGAHAALVEAAISAARAAEIQRKSRLKKKEEGIKEVSITLKPADLQLLEQLKMETGGKISWIVSQSLKAFLILKQKNGL